jgi:hypothetical protein
MFILGTSSVLALVPIDRIDLIAPIPQVLSVGFGALGSAAAVAPVTILVLLCIRVAQASVMFAGNTRLPMVAGWDGLLPLDPADRAGPEPDDLRAQDLDGDRPDERARAGALPPVATQAIVHST